MAAPQIGRRVVHGSSDLTPFFGALHDMHLVHDTVIRLSGMDHRPPVRTRAPAESGAESAALEFCGPPPDGS